VYCDVPSGLLSERTRYSVSKQEKTSSLLTRSYLVRLSPTTLHFSWRRWVYAMLHTHTHTHTHTIRFCLSLQAVNNIMSSVKTFAIGLFVFAGFFWCWALKNTIRMTSPNWDWGVVSFGSVVLTSTYLLALANLGQKPTSLTTFILVMLSHLLVSLNYLLGAYLGFTILARPGFGWYCVMFTGLWVCIAGLGARLLKEDSGNASVGSENLGLMA
jgi:hypothetical protein